MQPKCLQSVVPQNEPSPSAPTLLWPGSLIIPNLRWEVTVVLTKTHQLLPMITFPLPGDQPASPLMETKEFTAPHSSLCRVLISCFPWYWNVLRKNSSRDISTGWKPLLPSGTAPSQPRMLRHQSLETAARQLQWSVQMHWPCQNSHSFPEIPYSLSQAQPTLCFHHAL